MSKFIITVREELPPVVIGDKPQEPVYRDVFMLGVDDFDPLTFCAALKAKKVGRKAKAGKEGV